jgi:molybdenum cofactor cytidylyltransferase
LIPSDAFVSSSILAVVLGAGGGTRWRDAGGTGHKLLALLPDGRPVIRASVDAAVASGVPVCVVSGAESIVHHLPQAALNDGALTVVDNPDWASGQASSLRMAIDFAGEHGFEAVVIGLGDQPWVSADAWRAVIDRLRSPGLPIVVPMVSGHYGQPVGLRREVWPRLPSSGDHGARNLIREESQLVEELACSFGNHSIADVDTPGDMPWN